MNRNHLIGGYPLVIIQRRPQTATVMNCLIVNEASSAVVEKKEMFVRIKYVKNLANVSVRFRDLTVSDNAFERSLPPQR